MCFDLINIKKFGKLEPNKNFICCKKWMIGTYSDFWPVFINLLTVLILFLIIFFTGFVYFYLKGNYYIPIIGIILWLFEVYNNLAAILKDPGILIEGENLEKVDTLINSVPYELYKSSINFHRYRVCNTCKFIKPPKVSHCQYCNLCIKDFDHHCPFIANCVGNRNHINFFLFQLLASINLFFHTGVMIFIIIELSIENILIYNKIIRFYYLLIILGCFWGIYLFFQSMRLGKVLTITLLTFCTFISLVFFFVIYDYDVIYYKNVWLYYYLVLFYLCLSFLFLVMAIVDGRRLGSRITYKEKLQLKLNLEKKEKIKYNNCCTILKNLIKKMFSFNKKSEIK